MTARPIDLSIDHCRNRQIRIRDVLDRRSIDRVLFLSPENVQYLTGFRTHRLMDSAVCFDRRRGWILVAPHQVPEPVAADEIVTFPAQLCATLRQDQRAASVDALTSIVRPLAAERTAVEYSAASPAVHALVTGDPRCIVDIDADIWRLRRSKDPDELMMIGRAIECTTAMYERAREIIEPGINELEVYHQLHAAAVEIAGEPLTALGNDYQCNSPGGPPRDRIAQDGELFILDLGPAYRGYYADNCRTVAVNRRPTDFQLSAWEAIAKVLEMVESSVRPGVPCREVFQRAKSMLDDFHAEAFPHHLGHGFGLFPHEAPHLNPHWDDSFELGDVFTAEPGLYYEELHAGIRLEQNYVVTADGVQRLTDMPLEL